MNKKFMKWIALVMTLVLLTGCTSGEYQEEESYETDIAGTYELTEFNEEHTKLIFQFIYQLNSDNTFQYHGRSGNASVSQSGTFETESVSDDITKMIFDVKDTKIEQDDKSNAVNSAQMQETLYKYKNMLGSIRKADDFPTSKRFNYIIPLGGGDSGMVFTKDGYYHACSNVKDCKHDYAGGEVYSAKYIVKNKIIYLNFNLDDSVRGDYWEIASYVVDNYLFTPRVYKEKEQN